jgi:Glycosyl-transferase for dystroglycan
MPPGVPYLSCKHGCSLATVQQLAGSRSVVVLPTLQTPTQWENLTQGQRLADVVAAAPSTAALKNLIERGLAFQFAVTTFRWGHDCTNLKRWLNSPSGEPYSVRRCWSDNYEPYFIAQRTLVPLYDEVFRGYGWNKVSHVAALYHRGCVVQLKLTAHTSVYPSSMASRTCMRRGLSSHSQWSIM